MNLLESFQTNRPIDRFHAIIQFVLVFLILAAVNFIGMRNYDRIDLTMNRTYTLSAETIAYLEALDQRIDVFVTITENPNNPQLEEARKDVMSLLSEYEQAANGNDAVRIRVRPIDIYQESRRAKELDVKTPNAVIFKTESRQRKVELNELYGIQDLEKREFIGENAFTKAILELSEEEDPIIYFTEGHLEIDINNFEEKRGATLLRDALNERNLEIKKVNLANLEAAPDDAALIVIAAPQTRFLAQEQELLEAYLRKEAGSVMLIIDPSVDHGLDDLLFEWGILADDVVVLERDANSYTRGGDLMIRRFADEHPITAQISGSGLTLITDHARSVREDPGRPIDDSLVVTELLESSLSSWGERKYRNAAAPSFDINSDLQGPVRLATISERRMDSALGINLPGGKLIAIGSSEFLTNHQISKSANFTFILNAINYAIDRHAQLNIPPRPISKAQLDLSMEQLLLSRYLIWLAPPLLIGFLGLVVYLVRRN